MLATWRSNRRIQLAAGLLIGICFGFLLQRGGVTRYEVVMGQLLMKDFTVVKIMLTAIVTGMIGVYALRSAGWATFSKKPGSLGSTAIGGLIFGAGFGLLGYCPGTMIGAVGQGSLDALFGMAGMLIGTAVYAGMFPALSKSILKKGDFGPITIPELFRSSPWPVVAGVSICIGLILLAVEYSGV